MGFLLKQKFRWSLVIVFAAILGIGLVSHFNDKTDLILTKKKFAKILGQKRFKSDSLSDPLTVPINDETNINIETTLNAHLQKKVERLYQRYKPDYAAFVAIDAADGRILALSDFSKEGHKGNLALRSGFPAASVFKVVTSAAAIEEGGLAPNSRIPFNGSATSLYKRNLDFSVNRWTRFVSLEDALAKSINSVFGKIAAHGLGKNVLQGYANLFQFNKRIQFDLPLEKSEAEIPNDFFAIAESGSGYTREQTISPLHGALIAASVINKGWMPKPYLINSVRDEEGELVYKHQTEEKRPIILASTANLLSQMMERTIIVGTARKHYRDYKRHPILSDLFIGGKTGSLTGLSPRGKYDWFVGFAQDRNHPERKIAFASMIVNGKYWRVKSAYLARQAILSYFSQKNDFKVATRKSNHSNF